MTLIFSAATQDFITLTIDSAIVSTYSDRQPDYKTGPKARHFDGVGCVAVWGDLRKRLTTEIAIQPPTLENFDALDSYVEQFLNESNGSNYFGDAAQEVGYHIAGFDQEGRARLYHRFWGCPRPNPHHEVPDYRFSDHSPSSEKPLQLLYNGRNDIADTLVALLIREIDRKGSVRFDLQNPVDVACLGDFVARMAAELTREVEPRFTTFIILPNNWIQPFVNLDYSPIDRTAIAQLLAFAYPSPPMPRITFTSAFDATRGAEIFGDPASSAELYTFKAGGERRHYTGGTAAAAHSTPSDDSFDFDSQ